MFFIWRNKYFSPYIQLFSIYFPYLCSHLLYLCNNLTNISKVILRWLLIVRNSVTRICQGGYPNKLKVFPQHTPKSGSGNSNCFLSPLSKLSKLKLMSLLDARVLITFTTPPLPSSLDNTFTCIFLPVYPFLGALSGSLCQITWSDAIFLPSTSNRNFSSFFFSSPEIDLYLTLSHNTDKNEPLWS